MTPELTNFLKQNNNLDLINQRDFYTLFKNCPSNLKEQLLNMLDESNIDIINMLENDDTYYLLKYSGNKILTIYKKDQKSNLYSYGSGSINIKEDQIKVIIFPSFESALRKGIKIFPYGHPEPIKQSFVDKYKWVEVEIYGNTENVKALITQDCIDLFDPIKIKEKKIKHAAQDEYKRRLSQEVTSKLLINKYNLKEELKIFSIDSGDNMVAIYEYQEHIGVEMKYDPVDEKDIKSIIKKNLRYPADIISVDVGEDFTIIPIGKKVDLIKHEVEEEFDVDL